MIGSAAGKGFQLAKLFFRHGNARNLGLPAVLVATSGHQECAFGSLAAIPGKSLEHRVPTS
ncbi:hypothetical protein [Agrobacterium tumefaciens]|uniref:hypothetical protein n=1 Tax=Agrobacterium tumefaciens TaxID=358 RepID=UPI0022096589|nr:hypothetical protein FY131_27110 [Agrobacterium tumefaciens]